MSGKSRIATRFGLVMTAALLAAFAAGCGSSNNSTSTTTASTTETWATGVCTAITTWQTSIKTAVTSVTSNPSKDGLTSAANDAKSATDTLSSDLKGLGKPDTPSGQKAKTLIDQLSTNLSDGVSSIQSSIKNASGLSGLLSAGGDAVTTLKTMSTQVTSTLTSLQDLDAKGELKDAFTKSSACQSLTG